MPTAQGKLRLGRIRQVFFRHGTQVQYKQAETCECGAINDPESASGTCQACNGIGVRYLDPITMTVLMVQKQTKEHIEKYGILEAGTISISFLDEFRDEISDELYTEFIPAARDLIVCVNDKMRYAEVLERGAVHPISEVTAEKAAFLNVIDDTCRISQIGGIVYTEGTDYEIIDDSLGYHRIINWIAGGNSPDIGDRYSFSYTTHPSYVVYDAYPRHRREDNLMIMTHTVAKIIYLVEQFQ